MEESIQNLPPSKRFKFLPGQDPPPSPCLPAKKRLFPSPTTATCPLPAKKRVWAPHPLSPLKHQQQEEDEYIPKDDDDGIICAVCGGTDGCPADPIVFCDGPGCDLTVHASCYGSPLIKSVPDGDWLCHRCCSIRDNKGKNLATNCCLCPKPAGALKPTTDGRWAHILCALLVPEVFFKDPNGRDGIDCSRVPARRWKARCYLCGSKNGCSIECAEQSCELGFHVSCGVENGLSIEYKEGRDGGIVAGFCGDHTQIWKKQQLTGKFKIVARERQWKRKARG